MQWLDPFWGPERSKLKKNDFEVVESQIKILSLSKIKKWKLDNP